MIHKTEFFREQHFTPFYEVSDLLETVQDATQNEAHVDANIELLHDNYDEDPTEDNHNNHENEIEIDREDRIGENTMYFIDDSTIPVYTNYRKHSTKYFIPGEIVQVCSTCYTSLGKEKIPLMSTYNGFAYPKIPSHLPTLNLIEQRLISPRIPFMQIRRLRHVNGQYGIYGQIINVPVEVNTMVKQLPRNIEDDHCFYVHLKKKLIHKTSYVHGLINVLLLTETCMTYDNPIEIPNFNCIVQFKRGAVAKGGVAIYQNKNDITNIMTPNIEINIAHVSDVNVRRSVV
ncbi:unnamed protein product [Parnassius apollo]|uniref:(apollo) hypothetical protein n=1 Tax=Parnassius apollo TaxID=110799 RepID=A0A8S3XWJ1_PARAO|nr:unnamed protein product [Parnassius apollo]